jgi:methionine-rich copper-binding protein CopC
MPAGCLPRTPERSRVDCRSVNTSSVRLGSGLVGVVLALVVAVPALAHADLVASDPEDGAVLSDPPATVELTFSEGLDPGKSSFRLIGPDGDIGTASAPGDGATTMVLEGLVLAPGDYRIKWTAAADDGHVERGSIGFTVSAPTPAPATPSPAPTTATPAPTAIPATGTPVASPTPVEGEPAAASGTDVVIPIVVALVLAALVGGFVLRRSRRV